MSKTKQKAPVSLRLPADLQQFLAQQAQDGYRSLSQEIVMRLQQTRERQLADQQLQP